MNYDKTQTIEEIREYLKRSRELHDQKDTITQRENKDLGTTWEDDDPVETRRRSNRQNRKGPTRTSVRLLPRGRRRSSTRMVSRRGHAKSNRLGTKRSQRSNNVVVKKRQRNRNRRNNNSIPVTNTVSFEKGVMFREPTRQYGDNGTYVCLRGIEFITQLLINTTAHATAPGIAGNIVYVLPLAPIFIPGTEIYKEAQCWEKWKWKKCQIHYIPSCPSNTNGALIAWGETDQERATFALLADGPTRVREALARRGAKMFHPFKENIISMELPEYDKEVWFDTYIDEESELSIPLNFMVMLESAMTDPNLQTTMNCGQLLVEYEIEFVDKSMINGPIPVVPVVNRSLIGLSLTSIFANLTLNGPVQMKTTALTVTASPWILYVIIWKSQFSDTTAGINLNVSCKYNDAVSVFGSAGSIMYGYSNPADTFVNICPNIEDAIFHNTQGTFYWSQALTAIDLASGALDVFVYDISDLL